MSMHYRFAVSVVKQRMVLQFDLADPIKNLDILFGMLLNEGGVLDEMTVKRGIRGSALVFLSCYITKCDIDSVIDRIKANEGVKNLVQLAP